MTKGQELYYAYQQDRLLLLTVRRGKLPSNSNQLPALDIEMMIIRDLVRSYREVMPGEAGKATDCELLQPQVLNLFEEYVATRLR